MIQCVICKNSKNLKKKFTNLLECSQCGHIFANLNLDFSKVQDLYNDDYFFGNEYINYIKDKKQIQKNANLRVKLIKRFSHKFLKQNLFEIGCAYGFFLNFVKKKFNYVEGIDVNNEAIEYGKKNFNIDISCDDFETKNIEKNKFNIFCMWDVIEHLQNPDIYLKKINKISQKNSLLCITTGDIKSFNAKLNGKNWRLIHPPTHIHYFSKETIKKILENNNFEIINFEHCGYYRNLSFILNKINFLTKYFSWLIKILTFLKIDNLDIYLNIYDIMFIIPKEIN